MLAPRTGDAMAILDEQNATRVPELVPLRNQRMAESPFAFYRGSAAIMAADLSDEPNTDVYVASCGDAHLANFGFYASPQRTLVFDLNDFDEAAWAPWEWDLKRLVTSVILAGQSVGRKENVTRKAALAVTRAYAEGLRLATTVTPLDRFYAHFDAEGGARNMPKSARRTLDKAIKQAKKRTSERAARKLSEPDEQGRLRFIPAPPTMTELPEAVREHTVQLHHEYVASSEPEIRQLLRHYGVSDVIRRVVGVGSVGTQCTITLLQDGDGNALILQSKEAGQSVLERYGKIEQPQPLTDAVKKHGQGARVVGMQRILQAVSDPFLGEIQAFNIDLYVRQFHDMKGSIDTDAVDTDSFLAYARACGLTLARAHSQSPLAAVVSGYVGSGKQVGEAMWVWGSAYAERVVEDHRQFVNDRLQPQNQD
ncbi:DUF2252 domain-containing protein [Actinomycetaceae bacterium MB13-C1-2]|nr:DUF2252 domain-containing protein [Actinomycetaceae bacterium MB13-C1-2]